MRKICKSPDKLTVRSLPLPIVSKMQLPPSAGGLQCPAHDEAVESPSVGKAAALKRLTAVLLESRERWRELATLGSDIAFEVNSSGEICFVHPADALGYSEGQLLGARAASLLGEPTDPDSFDPFRPSKSRADRAAWLRDVEGRSRLHILSMRPLLDTFGNEAGVRGVGRDVDAQNRYDAAVAASLRRAELLDHILWRMRRETNSFKMMEAVLEALMNAVGAGGALLIDLSREFSKNLLIHSVGTTPGNIVTEIMQAVEESEMPGGSISETHSLLFHPIRAPRSGKAIIALWHHNHDGLHGIEERDLTASVSAVISIVMEHEVVQRKMNRQAIIDPLTNLLNRRAFFEEIERRINRSDQDLTSNVVLFMDLDNFKVINDARGHELGDECLQQFSALLRSVFRPTDLVARIGGDEFGVWMDGVDEFAASERMNFLRDAAVGILFSLQNRAYATAWCIDRPGLQNSALRRRYR